MKKTSETIVFFGSGPVAAESLRLLGQSFTVEAVVTKPRPPHHKGPVPVLDAAETLKLPVHTVTDKRTLKDLFATRPFQSKVAVLIDFGIIVPQVIIDAFPLGIVNSHFSLLPEWRGADPITFSVLSGQKTTGVSLMLLVPAMDEGPIIAQGTYEITSETTTPSLTDDLVDLSYRLLEEVLPEYIAGNVPALPQDTSKLPTYSRKLTKDDSIIDWEKPARQIEREVRAFAGWPKSRCTIGSLELVVTASRIVKANGIPGKPFVHDKKPAIYCGSDALILDRLKPAGKKEMTGEAFLAGYARIFLAG
ncbi:MAG TPA: methionyl-tRNA formyltransferase [Candidatus Saccharimonadales bacterium]